MRKILLAAALAATATTGVLAADCAEGSGEVLVVEDWMARLGEIQADGTRPLTMELSYRNPGEKTVTLVDGDVVFSIQTGEILVAAPIQSEILIPAGGVASEANTRNILNDPLERLIRASRADVLAVACVTLARYEDGTEQTFE